MSPQHGRVPAVIKVQQALPEIWNWKESALLCFFGSVVVIGVLVALPALHVVEDDTENPGLHMLQVAFGFADKLALDLAGLDDEDDALAERGDN